MKTNFQTILIGLFIAFFILAVMIFSGIIKLPGRSSSTVLQGNVVIWGTFPQAEIFPAIDAFSGGDKNNLEIRYVQKPSQSYQQELVKSFALGNGPDLFFISPEMIMANQNFIYEIPFTSIPRKTFNDTYIDGADIYLSQKGIMALPTIVDPLVLYYNKNILANNGIAKAPEYWEELFSLNETLTKKRNDGSISQSLIGLGRFDNVTNAKDILALLLLQGGNPLIAKNSQGQAVSTFKDNFGQTTSPAEAALGFFTEFSNPQYKAYSWNRSLPESKDFFTTGQLAFYIGKASELFEIESANSNLSFDVTQVLQATGSKIKLTFGDIYALAVSNRSANLTTAVSVASLFSGGENGKNLSMALSLPPANRALLNDKPESPYLYLFYNSAIISRSWLDPDSAETDKIFSELLNNILSNKLSIDGAINKAQSEFNLLINSN